MYTVIHKFSTGCARRKKMYHIVATGISQEYARARPHHVSNVSLAAGDWRLRHGLDFSVSRGAH